MVGPTLLHYRIIRALGRGGMGEVYAAEDTKLHRTVALKVLPALTADDPDRLARFQREAQAIAALNHPNVVTIYSVEDAGGMHFLTMELVAGKTLAAMIPPHGLPLADIMNIARPLVDAVTAAHAQGVVHRDLKPANVMVGPGGLVKVLDFGLAKLRQEGDGGAGASSVITDRLTAPNQVFGTPAYMSPEQIEGRTIDHRTDIFSLGTMLYEMTTGVRPFRGDTTVAVISSILKDTPAPLLQIKAELPADLDRIVRRCLAKDPARRYQTALDLRNELEDFQQQLTGTVPLSEPLARRPRGAVVRWTMVAAAAVAAALLVAAYYVVGRPFLASRATQPSPQASFTQLTSQPAAELFPSLSPDGKWVIYAGEGAGNRDVYLQSTTGQTPINLTRDSTADDEQPAFSPDGEQIVFRSSRDGGGLFVMGRTGEAVRRVTREGFNPAWSPDGKQLAYTTGRMELRPQNSEGTSQLWIVAADGTNPRKVYAGDATLASWSPDGRRIAFTQRLGADRNISILTIAVAGGAPVFLHGTTEIDWNPVWSPDGKFVYYASNRGGSMNLWRIAVDEESGQARGEPQPITTPAAFAAHVSVAADGKRVAYSSVIETQNIQRLSFDPVKREPAGAPTDVTRGSRRWSSPDPSPDGQWVAFYSQIQPEGDLYVIRSDGTGLRQLTADAAVDRVPRWSPDGRWIAAFSDRSGRLQVWKIGVDGSDLQQVTDGGDHGVLSWAPDGTRLAVTVANIDKGTVPTPALIVDLQRPWKGQTPRRLPPAPAPVAEFVANSWSPDGTRLAGQNGYITPGVSVYSIADSTYERVAEIGEWPVWFPDGRHVLVVSRGREFHVIDTKTKTSRLVYVSSRDTLGPPRLTRDGRTAYFSRRVTEADVWIADLR